MRLSARRGLAETLGASRRADRGFAPFLRPCWALTRGEDSTPEPSAGAGVDQIDDTQGPDFQWTGNGQRTLGTIRVKEPSVLRWRNNTGSSFGLGYDADYIEGPDHVEDFIDTEQGTGSVPVEPGVYRHIYMSAAAVGDWEITIEPR